ncbi:MAG: HD-GYP domain-containing protein [Pseudomonadales bacterium]
MSAVPQESPDYLPVQVSVLVRVNIALDRDHAPNGGPTLGRMRAADALVEQARAQSWRVCELPGPTGAMYLANAEDVADRVALVLLTGAASDDLATVCQLRERFRHALFVGETDSKEVDLVLPESTANAALVRLLAHAGGHQRRSDRIVQLIREVGEGRRRMHQLTDIGNSLTSSQELNELLETILAEARRIAGCEGASLYLLEEEEGKDSTLIFKLAQNEAIELPLAEVRLPLSAESIAGYVALFGRELNLADAYEIPADAPYHFNRSIDEQMGYRTRSMLVLPMRDHRDHVVGVLQFINRQDPRTAESVAFNEEATEVLRAIASQAAVSIQKNLLIADMNALFESFVQASVKTIEQRDPSTSGHSFRVADKTVALLTCLPQSNCHRFSELSFTPSHLKEVRYAALLHDFGKIGVRENVLVKAKKLTFERLGIIEHRVALAKERLRRQAVEEQLSLLHQGQPAEQALTKVYGELERELVRLDQFWDWVQRANEPNVLEAGDYAHLEELLRYRFRELDGSEGTLLSTDDVSALSVRRGSLTPEERVQIEAHVSHTREFLAMLRWPEELSGVPTIAGAHHEKLNGSGYPDGLVGDQIPLASRVMTVCDIYDALTAMDRPYKRAIDVERALSILEQEAAQELLDEDIVRIFIDSGVYQRSQTFG